MNARNGWEEGGRDGKEAKLVENKQVFVSNSPSNLMFELQSSLLELRLRSSRHGQGGREGERRGGGIRRVLSFVPFVVRPLVSLHSSYKRARTFPEGPRRERGVSFDSQVERSVKRERSYLGDDESRERERGGEGSKVRNEFPPLPERSLPEMPVKKPRLPKTCWSFCRLERGL